MLARHPAYTGKVIVTLRLTGTPALVSLRPGAITAAEQPRTARVEKREPGDGSRRGAGDGDRDVAAAAARSSISARRRSS